MMKLRFLAILLVLPLLRASAQPDMPERLPRSESFFGLHFDFHANAKDSSIGKTVTPEMIQKLIDQTKPDYIQIDCKGHPGYSSYPTKVGNPAPGFVKDPLKIWREVTARNGVALYMHYSGVIDGVAVSKHPEWAAIDAKGNIGGDRSRVTSVFGPYVDELLIPQLKELIDVYQVDGAWIDGECWALEVDYSDRAKEAFTKNTGINEIPEGPDDPHWYEYIKFNRDSFKKYLDHYVNAIHQYDPDFQIASNWAYSSYMPEPVTVNVDYISGDFSPINSLNRARIETRVLKQQGVPWDLMAWGFTRDWRTGYASHIVKTPEQIKQEASIVLSQGGGFMVYLSQRDDASIYEWTTPLSAAAVKFCRSRQEFTHKAKSVPQIGMILPKEVYYRINTVPYGKQKLQPFQGILQALINNQHVVDIVMEHNDLEQYPMLIYPEWSMVMPEMKDRLLQYVENGGNLLIIGPEPAAEFQEELGVELLGKPAKKINGVEYKNWLANNHSLSQPVKLNADAQPFGKYYQVWKKEGTSNIAASIRKVGKGKIAATYMNFGDWYLQAATQVNRDFLSSLVDEIFPDQVVKIEGSHDVDVSLNEIDGKLALNLVNTAGPHDNDAIYTFDDIPTIGPLEISIKMPQKPKLLKLQPANKELDFNYQDGATHLTLPKLDIHQIIMIEN